MTSKLIRVSEKEFRELHVLAARLQAREKRRISLREALAGLLKNARTPRVKVHSLKNQTKARKTAKKRRKKTAKRRPRL